MEVLHSLKHKPTHRDVWALAGPMVLSNFTVPLLGMVDTAVVGHLDEPHHMGAVAVGAMIFGVVFWGFGFLRMGTTGMTAQALGAVDYEEIRALLARAFLLALSISVFLIVLQSLLADFAFYLMGPTELVELHGRTYFTTRIFSPLNVTILVTRYTQAAKCPGAIAAVVGGEQRQYGVGFFHGGGFGIGGRWSGVGLIDSRILGTVVGVVFGQIGTEKIPQRLAAATYLRSE